ncbi:MAG TPA: phosphatase PAP2 family protein [Bacilli bacterium]|nr:phosphatase PAP2 family protein [Bacilli bacterium]
MNWELEFIRWLWEHGHFSAIIDKIMLFLTIIGDGWWAFIWMGPLVVFFIIKRKFRPMGIALAVGLLIFGIVGNNLLIKNIIARPRPIYSDPLLLDYAQNFFTGNLLPFIPKPTSYSFMSGHTVSVFIFATTISIFHRRLTPILIVFATLVSFSRIYFGFHYPTDVIAGLIYGVLVSFLAVTISKKITLRLKEPKNAH